MAAMRLADESNREVELTFHKVTTTVGVTRASAYRLACECGVEPWCDHKIEVVQQGMDASDLELLRVTYPGDDLMVEVPVFPTHNLNMIVTLAPITEHTTMVIDPSRTNDDFIGVISRTEGLRSLRLLILAKFNDFRAENGEGLSCTSAAHRVSYERAIQRAQEQGDTNSVIRNDFSIWRVDKCIHCNRVYTADFDEFVPDFSGAGRSHHLPWE